MERNQTRGTGQPRWPTLEKQLAEAKARPGSALEKLIRDNQDFALLRAEEADDNLGFPPWLRVYWRKAHPEAKYSPNDPSGGYPRILNRIHDQMLTHKNLPSD